MAQKDSQKKNKKQSQNLLTPFVDRELSWMEFNLRVLKEASDVTVPLLERLKFLSIYYSNLDEFFMVRVGSLIHKAELFPDERDEKTGWTPETSLKKLLNAISKQQSSAEEVYSNIKSDLKKEKIDIVNFDKISKVEESMAKKFYNELRPSLNPIIIDGSHPLPFMQNMDTYVAVLLGSGDKASLGIIPLFRLPSYHVFEVKGRQKVMYVPELIAHFSSNMFKKYDVREAHSIRVTRNADVFLDDSLATYDFKASMVKLLRKRKREQPVRLQVYGNASTKMVNLINEKTKIPSKYTFKTLVPTSLNFSNLISTTPEMYYEERRPSKNVAIKKGNLFKYLEKEDLLLSFPYQSVNPFIDLIYEAADDPDVVSIKITLYRLAATSKLATALAYAADNGKEVLCLLELRARFDEQSNIDYSDMLETAGCHVIYGLKSMKVHSKVCLITRKDGDNYSYITQIGTGNYNETTSEQYTDLSLITSRKEVGEDAVKLFESLSLGETPETAGDIITAPLSFKPWLLGMLDKEIEKGPDGRVCIKVNSLNDIDVMNKLIDCSKAGVQVELFIRGICCLKPGVIGTTDKIIVKSVVGRHLEHSRIYLFGKGSEEEIYIGSGDLLNRNTRRRVEAFVKVVSPANIKDIKEILNAFRDDTEKGSIMLPDGKYTKHGAFGPASQDRLYRYFSERIIELQEEKKGFFARLFKRFSKS